MLRLEFGSKQIMFKTIFLKDQKDSAEIAPVSLQISE